MKDNLLDILAKCQTDFYYFCKFIEPKSEILQSVLKSYHGQEICKFLTEIGKGNIKRGMINLPPRHCKTYLVKLFLTWFMGNFPDRDHILLSHTASLSETISGNVRDKLNSQEFKDIFPAVRLSQDSKSKSHFHLTREGKKPGQLISAGVMGNILGHGISGIGLIDDPIGKLYEARNPDYLDKLYDFYKLEFESRLDSELAIVLFVMQRMAEDDPCGRLLKDNPGEWTVLKLPIVYHGKPLWPEKFPMKRIDKIKTMLNNDYWFSCVYMQEPIDIKEKPFHIIKQPDIIPENMRRFAYVDPNWGGEDYMPYSVGGIYDGKIIITYGSVWQDDFNSNCDRLEKEIIKTKPEITIIESNSKGEAFISEMKHRGHIVKGIEHTENKFFRIFKYAQRNWARIYIDKNNCDSTYIDHIINFKDPLDWTKRKKRIDCADNLAGIVEFLIGKEETATVYQGKQTKWL
jgi:hypothetical protein